MRRDADQAGELPLGGRRIQRCTDLLRMAIGQSRVTGASERKLPRGVPDDSAGKEDEDPESQMRQRRNCREARRKTNAPLGGV